MAASDQHYRNQYILDIVFAVCSILLLVSTVGMLVQDYFKEFKEEQRSFRDVESAVAQRLALAQIPTEAEFDRVEAEVKKAQKEREANQGKIDEIRSKMAGIQPYREKSEMAFQDVKAMLESRISFYNIEVEKEGVKAAQEKYGETLKNLRLELNEAKVKRDGYVEDLKNLQRELEKLETPLTEAQSAWKKVNDKFETQAKLSILKQWTIGDTLRSAPVLDAFASPIKIQQYTINDVPIDYNFKQVTRFDRCTTCHLGIDRPAYTREMLASLTKTTPEQNKELETARARLQQRKETLAGSSEVRIVPDPNRLGISTLAETELTPVRIREFAAHPRLELFVGANSKHPVEKFGCTSCHDGQGSATSFTLAAHSPNNSKLQETWIKEHDWENQHMWDFPMRPMRFVESGCLKCHHQVTDLYSTDYRNEAPKLLRGYNLIRENGCFGCHEINGRKGGRQVGPDLRLEPNPPLEALPPAERVKLEADVDNPPGQMRKVGPSLYRLAEKTNPEWTARWLRAPREFRPDTKMPHYFGQANNSEESLKGTGQEKFPNTEIRSIAFYLFKASNAYLKEMVARHKDDAKAQQEDQNLLQVLQNKAKLTDEDGKNLAQVQRRIKLRQEQLLVDPAPGYAGEPAKGRLLFSERGCLACHSHKATETPQGNPTDPNFAPAVTGEAQFGPNLSQLAAKLGNKESARIWLMQWILNPHVHSPRSRMPVTHLDSHQVADLAAWLLAQKADDLGPNWNDLAVPEPDEQSLKDLAKVYLVRLLPKDTMNELLEGKKLSEGQINELPQEEQELARVVADSNKISPESLKNYLGKKALGRLGCYACHDIPGFDNAKPIGVGLMDWGKKDPGRLAFEDIASYLKEKYHVVPSMVDKEGKPVGAEEGKRPYEKFFADALLHHQREGFLHQKLLEPRSYDYNRLLAWDDRSRMPQFQFARSRKKSGETDEEFANRVYMDEADAREAVMTFVLGLVAEPVPIKSINQPTGDRLATVKGRQILDKYNCAGCHLTQPGVLDFRTGPKTRELLEISLENSINSANHAFPYHHNWAAQTPDSPNQLQAHGVNVKFEDNEDFGKLVKFRLSRALRFYSDKAKDYRDIPASSFVFVNPEDMIYPLPEVIRSGESLKAFLRDFGPLGGSFANLLVEYLSARDQAKQPNIFKKDENLGDSSNARAAGPPSLIGQGERTQTDWLYQFLLDPQPIRRMAVLRMPRFNMSRDEAQALVAYFAAEEKIHNPGTELSFPSVKIPQGDSLDSTFWQERTSQYVARLKATKDPTGKMSMYEQRLQEMQPIWKQVLQDHEYRLGRGKAQLDIISSATAKVRKDLEKARQDLKDNKDNKDLAAKVQALDELAKEHEKKETAWKSEIQLREEALKAHSIQAQKDNWEKKEAYLADGYRLVVNRILCLQCHQAGKYTPDNRLTEGPPLHEVYKRLRPGWTERWIAVPQRFLPYQSVMPVNFPADKNDQFQQFLAGSSLDQVTAARDLLMAFPRADAMPASRYFALPLLAEKTGENK